MAPLAYRTNRVTIRGLYGGGVEEWSTGFWFGAVNQDADLPTQALADGIRGHWATFITAIAALHSNNWTSDEVKVSSFGTDGKSSAEDTVYSTFSTKPTGTASLNFPPQIALAATMTSSKARGVASKGRMFLPGIVAPVQPSGTFLTASQTTIATAFKAFINNVNSLPENNVVVLASHGSLTKNADGVWIPKVGGSAPQNLAVQGVKIGNVYDTQRRRRNGIPEVYVSQSLV